MTRTLSILVFLGALFLLNIPTPASACDSDLDCGIGSECRELNYMGEGICVGGTDPGNANDENPYQWQDYSNPFNDTIGETCSSNFDCDGKCLKEPGSLYGTCM